MNYDKSVGCDSDHGLGDSLVTHWAINQRKSRDWPLFVLIWPSSSSSIKTWFFYNFWPYDNFQIFQFPDRIIWLHNRLRMRHFDPDLDSISIRLVNPFLTYLFRILDSTGQKNKQKKGWNEKAKSDWLVDHFDNAGITIYPWWLQSKYYHYP